MEARVDLARWFFPSPEIERQRRAVLSERFSELKRLRDGIGDSPAELLEALELRDELMAGYEKHDAYLTLRYATDTADTASRHDEARLWAEAEDRLGFLDEPISKLREDLIQDFIRNSPALQRRAFEIDQIRRAAAHHRPRGPEWVSVWPELTGWQGELYDLLVSRAKAEPIRIGGKILDPNRDRLEIATNPDSGIRREGFQRRFRAYRGMRDLFAFTLLRLAESNNQAARLSSFADAPTARYFDSFLSVREVRRLLSEVKAHADLHKEYERLKARRARLSLGLDQAHVWDVRAGSGTGPSFDLEAARAAILEAVAPLGPEYRSRLSQLLDPANGRFDAASGPNRKAGGFSKGGYGFQSVLFSGRFTGSYNDVRVLAHEGGHAVHRQLMSDAGTLPGYVAGPPFLFESFAILNELLLADSLLEHEVEPKGKLYYLSQFLDGKGMIAFVAAPEAELEQEIHERSLAGEIHSADDLDALTRNIFGAYSIWPGQTPELQNQWMMIPLMYEDPFYDLNYVYGGLLGLQYYRMLKSDPEGFRRKYLALLKNGFDAPPDVLLRRFLGIDLHSRDFVNDAMAVLAGKMKRLRRLGSTN